VVTLLRRLRHHAAVLLFHVPPPDERCFWGEATGQRCPQYVLGDHIYCAAHLDFSHHVNQLHGRDS